MSNLEVIARLRIRPGQVEGFKKQASEIMRLAREKDTQTVRYDWFIDEDALECEVHEEYLSEQGLLEHNQHVLEPRALIFKDFAYDHRMSVFGPISQQLVDLATKHAGGVGQFAFFQGLKQPATV